MPSRSREYSSPILNTSTLLIWSLTSDFIVLIRKGNRHLISTERPALNHSLWMTPSFSQWPLQWKIQIFCVIQGHCFRFQFPVMELHRQFLEGPLGPSIFIFLQFLGKFCRIIGLCPPPWDWCSLWEILDPPLILDVWRNISILHITIPIPSNLRCHRKWQLGLICSHCYCPLRNNLKMRCHAKISSH